MEIKLNAQPSRNSGVKSVQEFLDRMDAAPAPIPPRDRSRPCPLSPDQERLWFMEQLNPRVPVFNEAEAVRLRGRLNAEALEQALNVIIARHELLRSTIKVINEQPIIAVHDHWPIKFKQVDLQHWPTDQREAEVSRLLVEEPRRPYKLQTEPGIRATLIQLASQEHVFILMMHHLVCDWSSEGVLWRELSEAYRALAHGEAPRLPPLPIQHGDYAAWQKQQMLKGGFADDLAFWEEKLRGAPPLLNLPTDRPRPGVTSYAGARQRFRIGPALVEALRECSRREQASLFSLLTAALNALLYRYTGSEDILLGTPLAHRDRPEVQSMIGFLLQTHGLRTQLSGEMTFRELIRQVQRGVLDLYAHRAVPFGAIVSKVRPERNLSHAPLFQVMINWHDQDQQLSFIGMEGLRIEPLPVETQTSKFDLALMLTADAQCIWLEAEYNTDLFEAETIRRMLGHYQTLLAGVVSNPEQRVADLPVLTEAERRRVLVEWNRTETAYPKDRCLHELIEEQVERTPEAEAVVFGEQRLTYRELDERANQLARQLQTLGVGPETLVGICVERSREMVVGLLGILKAGGAYVPMDPGYPKERLAFMLEDAQPKVLLTQQHLRNSLPAHPARVIELDADWPGISGQAHTRVRSETKAENLAYVIYTSGSTGKPKGAMNTHRGICNRLLWMQTRYGLKSTDAVLQKTPFSFDVSVWEFFWPLLAGARLVIARPGGHLEPDYLAGVIETQRITIIHFVPSMLRVFLEAADTSRCVSLRHVICSGETLGLELSERFFGRSSAQLHNLYGPTEAAVDVTHWTCERNRSLQIVPIGRPVANTQVYILDAWLQPVPIGIPGELHVGGAQVGRGYLHRPDLTAEKFIPDLFTRQPGARLYKTGDRCRWLPDGNIEYLGRLDHQVKIRGFRVELGEIESVLAEHPGAREAVVVVREDHPGDQRLVAYVASRNGGTPTASGLRSLLQRRLPDYMVPSAFVILDRLPLMPNGKVDRRALPKPEFESAVVGFVPPRTPTEIALARIWCEVLGLKQIGLHDNFFELGGHSLLATRIISRMRHYFEVNLPLRSFFESPTVEGTALSLLRLARNRAELEKRAELLLKIAELSESEVNAMLAAGS